MENTIFICCGKNDSDRAREYAELFKSQGADVYVAAEGGKKKGQALEALRGAVGALFILSPGFEKEIPQEVFSLSIYRYAEGGFRVWFDLCGVTPRQAEDALLDNKVLDGTLHFCGGLAELRAKPDVFEKITGDFRRRATARDMLREGIDEDARKEIAMHKNNPEGDKELEECLELLDVVRGRDVKREKAILNLLIDDSEDGDDEEEYCNQAEMDYKYDCFNIYFYPGLESDDFEERLRYYYKNGIAMQKSKEQAVREGNFRGFKYICLNGMIVVNDKGELVKACRSVCVTEVPEGVKCIREGIYDNSGKLRIAILPRTLETIGARAFSNCKHLNLLVYGGSKAEWDKIEKAPGWKKNSAPMFVRCTDGEYRIN